MSEEFKFLNELPSLSAISDQDLLLIEDTNYSTVTRKITVGSLRAAFQSGFPSLDDYPGAALDPPDWKVEGLVGQWRIVIEGFIEGVEFYMLSMYDEGSDSYLAYDAVWEVRRSSADGILTYTIDAPFSDPPQACWASFKIQAVTTTHQGTLSSALSAWSDIYLPSDWEWGDDEKPVWISAGGYPSINVLDKEGGTKNYYITMRWYAPKDANNKTLKDYVDYYKLQRLEADDDGNYPDPVPESAWKTLTMPKSVGGYPKSKIEEYNCNVPDRPGRFFKWRVRAVALNGDISPWSAESEVELTADTTAPDAPTLAVTTGIATLKITFDAPTQNTGETCYDADYFALEVSVAGGGWSSPIKVPCTTQIGETEYVYEVASGQMSSNHNFRAKAYDQDGNTSGYSSETGNYTPGKLTGNTQIVDLSVVTALLAENAVITSKITALNVTGPKISSSAVETDKLAANAVTAVKIAALQINTGHLIADAVTAGKIAALAIDTGHLAANAVTAAKIEALTITANEISATAGLSGGQLHITSGVVFDSDCEIQGLLKATGGIKSASSGQRIEMGYFGSFARLDAIDGSNELRVRIEAAQIHVYDYLGVEKVLIQSSGIGISGSSGLDCGGYIKTGDHYKVGANQVVGARKAAIANPGALTGVQAVAGSDTINMASLNYLLNMMFTELGAWYTCFNNIRGTLKATGGHGLTAD